MASYVRLKRRNAKRMALLGINTPEARKEYKGTLTFKVRSGRVNPSGFFEPKGKHPIRCK
jgi:hypothetical protein